MKNFFLALVALVLLVTSCKNSSQSPFVKKVGNYSVVTIEAPDLSGISDNGKEVLNLYRFAADEVDAIYWEQYFGDKQSLLGGLKDSMQKVYAEINYGPWDRLDGKSFVEGYADRTPGVEYYPSDMTAEEFEQFDNPDKMSPYTLIRRGENGTLETVWYHDAYKAHVEKIANYLKAAADITIKPSVKKYLLSKADALLTDNYYDSDIAWLDMVDSKMDLVIGPNETVDDQLMGLKRSSQAPFQLHPCTRLALKRVRIASDCAYLKSSFPDGCVVEFYDQEQTVPSNMELYRMIQELQEVNK